MTGTDRGCDERKLECYDCQTSRVLDPVLGEVREHQYDWSSHLKGKTVPVQNFFSLRSQSSTPKIDPKDLYLAQSQGIWEG